MIEISAIQQDMLAELLNVGIGRAAASLSEMTDEEVLLNVPNLQLLSREELPQSIAEDDSQPLRAVRQSFSGAIVGEGLLCFPEDRSLELVRVALQREIPLDQMTELEEEALLEVGNIILNACLSSFADTLDLEIASGLPKSLTGTRAQIVDQCRPNGDDVVFFMSICFTLKGRDITGFVTFALDVGSLETLITSVDRYLERIGLQG